MFKSLQQMPEDPTFKLLREFEADPNPDKVNLGIGLYFDGDGEPFVLDVVKKAVRELDLNNFNYLPIRGSKDFLELSGQFIFGESYDRERLAMQATAGGTQACRAFADLSMKVLHNHHAQLGVDTWVNYYALFKGMKIEEFKHCGEDGAVNYVGHLEAAKKAPEGSAFVVQGGLAHNPSGVNLSVDEMRELIEVLNEKKMILFMDMAYFGFGEGIEKDREHVRVCFDHLERFAVGISYSKNASLYEHRCGALFVKTVNKHATETHLQQSVRESISTPPGFGQEVMTNILRNYRVEWEAAVEGIREDIDGRREALVARLPEEFAGLRRTRGMFGLLPLTFEQVLRLRSEFGIYVLNNGRVNFAGLKEKDLDYIVKGVRAVM